MGPTFSSQQFASLILRLGLAFVLGVGAVYNFIDPVAMAGYIPSFVTDIVPSTVFLPAFAVYEALLAAWLIIGKGTFWAASLAAITLTGITILNIAAFSTVFRNFGLVAAAAALAVLSRNNN